METQHRKSQYAPVAKTVVAEQLPYVALDECRVAFTAGITLHFLEMLLGNEVLPNGMNRNVLSQTMAQLQRCIREIKRTVIPHEPSYLDRNLKKEKILDLATIIDTVARVGIEEAGSKYEEFLGIVIESLDSVYYAQENRKGLHFGKYKALFKMFSDEVKADVNGTRGQMMYSNQSRQLFVRIAEADKQTEL